MEATTWYCNDPEAGEILQGTLDMLIPRTLVMGPAHGHTIAQVIEHTSENALEDFRVVACERQLSQQVFRVG